MESSRLDREVEGEHFDMRIELSEGRTIWLLPYALLGSGVKPISETFGIAMFGLSFIHHSSWTARDTRCPTQTLMTIGIGGVVCKDAQR